MSIDVKGEEYVENIGAAEKPQPHPVKKVIGRSVIVSLWAVVFGVVFVLPNWYFRLWHVTFMVSAFLLAFAAMVLSCVAVFKVSWCLGSKLGDWSEWNRDMSAGLCALIFTVGCVVLIFGPWSSEWCNDFLRSAWNLGLGMPHHPESGHGWFWSHLPTRR